MMSNKRKGFTTVELVIVIAVIAILATVLIPTFASIIGKANESADIQAVRQMNIVLEMESVVEKPDTVAKVINILASAGYNSTDKLVPVSAGHGFYWSKETNKITLIRDEGENSPELIFPTEETAVNTAFEEAKTNFSAINFGADKAVASNDRTFFDLEPAGKAAGLPSGGETGSGNGGGTGGGTGGESGGGNGGSGGPVTTAADLIAALEAGGDVTLGASIEITEAISIPSEKAVTINLGGHTLTFNDSSDAEEVIGVAGTLTIKDEAEGSGKVVLNANYTDTGISVKEGGALTLENVSVDGSYCWNIENYGTTTLNNVQVTVPGGYGFANAGTATITGSTFTATGEYGTTTIYNHTGTLNISETTVGESGTVSYSNGAAVLVYQGAVSMENVTVTTGADAYSVCAKNSSQVTITGDESAFNTQFLCAYGSSCSFTIYGGTINGTAFEDITAASGIFIGGQHNLTPGDNCWIIAPKS